MKIRFCAALLLAALSLAILSGCAAVSAAPAPSKPILTATEEPTVPAAPESKAITPAPTEIPMEAPAPQTNRLTKEEAIAIALKDAGLTQDQITGLRAEFDYDDGRPEYDVEFRQDRYEYDYEIHAETGKILSRDKDWDD